MSLKLKLVGDEEIVVKEVHGREVPARISPENFKKREAILAEQEKAKAARTAYFDLRSEHQRIINNENEKVRRAAGTFLRLGKVDQARAIEIINQLFNKG